MNIPFKKVQPVVAYAARHLDDDLSLEVLAAQAGLSPFHLHRGFTETAGETPKQLTQRLRLERAAVLLLTSRSSILNIALRCGFKSHEVFCRTFRRHFGTTPHVYRKRGFAQRVSSAQGREHARLVTQVGRCIGLFHIREDERTHKNEMTYSITKKQLSAQPVLVIRRKVKLSELAKTLGETFGQIGVYTRRAGIAMAGPPLTRYIEWGPGLLTIEAGMPVAMSTPGEGEIKAETLPGGWAAVTIHAGPYDGLSEAHAAVQQWIEAEGLAAAGGPWESYITDPGDFPDPKDWKTEIFWPVEH
jgi:AraC family transcriptional regulator